MANSLTELWLGSLMRLMAIHPEPVPSCAKRATRWYSATPSDGTPAPTRRKAQQPGTCDSRVGSRTRSLQSAPAAPGRLATRVQYGLYIPPGKSSAGMPLVVMLHGCNQSADDLAEGTRMNLLADRFGFAVVYPEQSKHAHGRRCWHWYDTRDKDSASEMRTIAALVDALVAEHKLDGGRVYVAGLSAGAGLAALLAAHHPERFAAVGLHSGPVFGDAHSAIAALDVMRHGTRHDPVTLVNEAVDVAAYPGMPAIILHGDADLVVAPVNADQLALQFLRLNGLLDANGKRVAGELREEHGAGTVTCDYTQRGRRVVRLCCVQALRHAWSGGDDALPFHAAGGLDASMLMWEFFRDRRRQDAALVSEKTSVETAFGAA